MVELGGEQMAHTGAMTAARRWTRWGTAAIVVAAGSLGLTAGSAQAVPIEGATSWSVLLCKFSGTTDEPKPLSFFQDFLTESGAGKGGAQDYFSTVSRGKVTLRGSTVHGWYTLPYTLAQSQQRDRWTRIQDCVAAAKAGGYTVPAGNRVVASVNQGIDAGSAGGQVYLDPGALNDRFAVHEMLHGYNLGHSFSNDTSYQNASWSAPGEYDDTWDEMSAQATYAVQTPQFGASAVGLNAYHLDKLGWLPTNRVVTAGADGRSTATYTLSSLETPATSGVQLLRIPFDPADLNHYYTVELRSPLGVSQGIPAETALIHEVKSGTPYLQRGVPATRNPITSLTANGVSIQVGAVSNHTVPVTVTTNMTTRCVNGYVWREARPGDLVCVTGATRTQVAADNAAASSRWVNGPYGPHTCINGYVWREAYTGDDVCVAVAQRTQAAADNAAAASRANPARLVYGPNTCVNGYVWREANKVDYVCVTGATRTQVAADNAAASSRWVNGPYGPHTCINGYVWREAYLGDDVCVTGTQRTQAAADNAAAASRVASPNG
ncbi:MAG TPA: hypothetical protein VFP72_19880 [Kineosporiaceae bacterium]|nr:hypothetical protein [Kineosporiaceae bacterium]